jgi:hypothetical protein
MKKKKIILIVFLCITWLQQIRNLKILVYQVIRAQESSKLVMACVQRLFLPFYSSLLENDQKDLTPLIFG